MKQVGHASPWLTAAFALSWAAEVSAQDPVPAQTPGAAPEPTAPEVPPVEPRASGAAGAPPASEGPPNQALAPGATSQPLVPQQPPAPPAPAAPPVAEAPAAQWSYAPPPGAAPNYEAAALREGPEDRAALASPIERSWLLVAPDAAWAMSHGSRLDGELTRQHTPVHAVGFMPGALLRVDVPVVGWFSLAATGRVNRMQSNWQRQLGMSPRTLLGVALTPTLRIPVPTGTRHATHFYISVPLGLNWATADSPDFETARTEVETGFGPYWGVTLGNLVSVFEHLGFGLQVAVTQHSVKQSYTTTNGDGTLRQHDQVEELFSVLHFSVLLGGNL